MFGKKRKIERPDAIVRQLMDIVGEKEVLYQKADLISYECDGYTMSKGMPKAVVFVKNTAQVAGVVKFLNKEETPYIARGAGTGLSGGATPLGGEVLIKIGRASCRERGKVDGVAGAVKGRGVGLERG